MPTSLSAALNSEQLAAATSSAQRMLILAGAGTGKTRTLVYRVVHLVQQGVEPGSIVLVTFTQKAAHELKERLSHLLGPVAQTITTGTFHSIALRIIKNYVSHLGYGENFKVLGPSEQKQLMEEALQASLSLHRDSLPVGAKTLIKVQSLSLNTNRSLKEMVAEHAPQALEKLALLEACLDTYAFLKVREKSMDFDDLLFHLLDLLKPQSPAHFGLQQQLQHVLVDEYQDTTWLQAELCEAMAEKGSLTVVGDDAQSIYGFRGASFENILNYPRKYPTEAYQLTQNYRSSPEILALANASIAHNPLQFPKTLQANLPSGPKPVLFRARSGQEEASFIAQTAAQLAERGIPLKEQAVLFRAHYQSAELELAFKQQGLPFSVRAGQGFFAQLHVREALNYLRILSAPSDLRAWQGLLKSQPGIGEKSSLALLEIIKSAPESIWMALREDGPRVLNSTKARDSLLQLLQQLKELAQYPKPHQVLARLFQPSGPFLQSIFRRFDNGEERKLDLLRLQELARNYSSHGDFLSESALGSGANASENTAAGLQLCSIHQAKGLQWKVVFVSGLVEGGFPLELYRADQDHLAEERRLFYVAATRAEKLLYLSYPAVSNYQGKQRSQQPSRFISELPEALFEVLEL